MIGVGAVPASGVQRGDGPHLGVVQSEIEHIEILADTFGMRRFGQHDHTALQVPANHDLGGRLAVLLADAGQQGSDSSEPPVPPNGL